MKNPTIRNHYLSRFFSNNFRVIKGNPLWLLDCKTGMVTNRKTREDFLFMKERAWSQSLEDAFGQKLENRINPLINSLLHFPYNVVTKNFCIESLDKKYNKLLNYCLQTVMLQLSNRNNEQIEIKDETMIENFFEYDINLINENAYLIRFNHLIFANMPLVLLDNAVSMYLSPAVSTDLEYSCCYFMPISPYNIVFFGTSDQLRFFVSSNQNPHKINIYRILLEDKKCLVASQNKDYLKWLSTEYVHYQLNNQITPKTTREFI